MKPNKILVRHKEKLLREEKMFLEKRENLYWKETLAPVRKKMDEIIPTQALSALRQAFEMGFNFVFERGTLIIEKSYSSQLQKDKYDINQYILSKAITKKNLKRFDRQAAKNSLANKSISAAEGAFLGVLGIGLPDIPIFIGVILRTVYEICLSYGFEYAATQERIFILSIISTAAAKGEGRTKYSAQTDRIGFQIDAGKTIDVNLQDCIKETSDNLAASLLGAKFLQGLPIVGAVGGVTNLSLIQSVSRLATFKYKKRFLRRTLSAFEGEK